METQTEAVDYGRRRRGSTRKMPFAYIAWLWSNQENQSLSGGEVKQFWIIAGLFMGLLAAGIVAPAAAKADTACADLASTHLSHAEVTKAATEMADGKILCRLSVTSRPTKDSDIRIEIWLPQGEAWNGKFVQLGNGGFAGSIPSGRLRVLAAQGFAAAGTDDGHQSLIGTSASWAYGHPEKIADFGWRAVKETTDVAKALIRTQSSGLKQSYFFGCSDGGREALMTAQRFPADFDGIIAGAPANYMSRLFGLSAAQQQALSKPGAYLEAADLALLQRASLAECASGDSFIRDPLACRFDPKTLACKAGQTAGCLSPAQIAAARTIYQGHRDPRSGRLVFPGFSPGAEAVSGGWGAWITGASQDKRSQANGYQFSSNAFKYFAFENPSYDFLKLDLGAEFDRAHAKMAPIIDADSPDLSAFKRHGGKLLSFHGWNDPAIPARSSIRYYEDVRRTMGDPSAFYKLYLMPGMLHCGGGPGPGNVDWLSELDAWVVAAHPPATLIATGPLGASQTVCPYPVVARKTGKGWSCTAPRPR